MSIVNTVIVFIIAVFFMIGILDKSLFNGKLGMAKELESGVQQVGGLILSLVGIMCLAPLLGKIVTPIVSPIYNLIGADPANFAGIILGPDGGAFPITQSMTNNTQVLALSGLFLASMLGVTICFSLPFSLGVVEEKDRESVSKGMLAGIITSPFGAVISGLISGFDLLFILKSLSVAFLIVFILVIALIKVQNAVIKGFLFFSKIISTLSLLSLGFASFEMLTGIKIIYGLDSIGDKLGIIGNMGITIGGALCMVAIIQKIMKNPLIKLGKLLGINEVAVIGIVVSLANAMPVYSMLKDMDERGKILSIAFSVPACYALGSHLAYVATMLPEYIFPEVVGKIICGVMAMGVAYLMFCRKEK